MDNKNSTSSTNLNVDKIGLVRLSRIADSLSLSAPLRISLKDAVLDGLEATLTQAKQQSHAPRSRNTLAKRPPEQIPHREDPYSSWTVDKLEYHIRRAVNANVSWTKIEPYAWKMFEIDRSAAMAGRIVELSYLQGGLPAAIQIMESLAHLKVKYFQHIHEKMKIPLIINLWCRSEVTLLTGLIDPNAATQKMSPLEKYFAFWHSLHGQDPGRPVMYYQKHKAALQSAAEEYGDKVGFSKDKFFLILGRLHLELGMEENARILLENIHSNSNEYADALDTLLKLKITKNQNGHSVYSAKLNAEAEWQKRIHLFSQFFATCRRLGSFRDTNRPALNELLTDPLKWFPKTIEAWSAFSDVISQNLDLSHILPELTRIFRDNSLYIHSPELDKALWSGVIQYCKRKNPLEKYLVGVAKLHYFAASGSPTCEQALWEAKSLIDETFSMQCLPFAHSWQDYYRFCYQYIAKSVHHTEANREQNLRQLKVTTDPKLLAVSDITRYLQDSKYPSADVLTNLQYIARSRQLFDTEVEVILRRASISHLTNRDIESVWHLANKLNDWDLAWRAVSVLSYRKKINNSVTEAWKISGEKRSFYPLINLSDKHLYTFMDGFSKEEKRFIKSCVEVGPQIPELLYLLDKNAKTSKNRQYRADSIEFKSTQFLDSLKWLPSPKKAYQFGLDGLSSSDSNTPFFLGSVPTNQWTFIVQQIALRLGVTSWNWKLSRLHSQIEDIIPRVINRQDLLKSSSKISKWMRGLNADQKSAWNDLAKMSSQFTDENASYTLYRFIIRLATLICVNHQDALKSLYSMKVPVFIIWEFEQWLLSPHYSRYRTALGLHSKVPVPRALRNLSTL